MECHRNPRALARPDSGSLASFLRAHYTASRESAAALAGYLSAMAPDPRAGSAKPASPGRAPSRPASSAAKPSGSEERIGPEGQIVAPTAKPRQAIPASAAKPAEPANEPKTSAPPEAPQPPAAIPAPASKPPESDAKPPPSGDNPD